MQLIEENQRLNSRSIFAYIAPGLPDIKRWRVIERATIRLENINQSLRIKNQHLQEKLEPTISLPDRYTEADTKLDIGSRSKKRSRSDTALD